MKFTNGYWMIRDGVDALYAREAYELAADATTESLNVLAPTAVVRGRYDTLDLPTFNVDITTPAEGVIRVRAEHWQGATEYPGFPLNADEPGNRDYVTVQANGNGDGEVGVNGADVTLTTGGLTAKVVKGTPWNLTFIGEDGKVLTECAGKSLGRFKLGAESNVTAQPVGEFGVTMDGSARDESDVFTAIQLHLSVGEDVYGLGERFGAYVKKGQSVDIWNEDGGTASEQGYKDIPFYMTSNGYGVLVNNRGHVSFEIGSENTEAVQFSVPGEAIDFCVIYGPTPKQILDRYTKLVGRPANVPAWSYGLWLTTSFTTKYGEATINSFIDGMAERDIPLAAFQLRLLLDARVPLVRFRVGQAFLRRHRIHAEAPARRQGPAYLRLDQPVHRPARRNVQGRPRQGLSGAQAQWRSLADRLLAGRHGLGGLTNPAAREWFKDKVKALLNQGVDAIKTDFGERIPRDVVWYDGSPKLSMHNWYTQLYNQAVFEAIEETYGKGNACLYARSATVGGQQQPVHWGGDCESTFNGMAQSLRAGLSLTSSGFGFWSHDIGGFEGAFPDPAVYKRLNGTPVMRSMFVEFPDDPACRTLDRQYMFGPSMLVAPVFTYSGEVSYYLPDGVWTNWLTGEKAQGGWRKETHDYDSIPLWVRDGSVIVTNPGETKPDRVYGENALVSVFVDEVETADAVVTEIDGPAVTFTARRTPAGIEVASSDGRPFRARLGASGGIVEVPNGSVVL